MSNLDFEYKYTRLTSIFNIGFCTRNTKLLIPVIRMRLLNIIKQSSDKNHLNKLFKNFIWEMTSAFSLVRLCQ